MAALDRDQSNPENNSLLRCVIHQQAEGHQGAFPESAPFLENSQWTLIYTVVMDSVAVLRGGIESDRNQSTDTVNIRGRLQ